MAGGGGEGGGAGRQAVRGGGRGREGGGKDFEGRKKGGRPAKRKLKASLGARPQSGVGGLEMVSKAAPLQLDEASLCRCSRVAVVRECSRAQAKRQRSCKVAGRARIRLHLRAATSAVASDASLLLFQSILGPLMAFFSGSYVAKQNRLKKVLLFWLSRPEPFAAGRLPAALTTTYVRNLFVQGSA